MFSTVNFSLIKGLQSSFPELGRIKIGMLGPEKVSQGGKKFRMPVKLDYIRVTQRVRDAEGQFALDEEVHKVVGEKPTELAVTLLYDDPTLNCPSRLACYQGSRRWCHGNGEQALRLDAQSVYREQACPCPLLLAPESAEENRGKSENQLIKCKPNGSLGVQLPYKQSSVGIYRFRTTSLESIQSILTVQSAILMRTGGVLGGIPLRLRLYPATDNTPGGAAKSWKVTLDLPAGGWAEVDEAAREIVRARSSSRVAMKAIEADARRKMKALGTGTSEADALIDELFPRPVTECGGVEVLDDEPDGSTADLGPILDAEPEPPATEAPPAPAPDVPWETPAPPKVEPDPEPPLTDEARFLDAWDAEKGAGTDAVRAECVAIQLDALKGIMRLKGYVPTSSGSWALGRQPLTEPLEKFSRDKRKAFCGHLCKMPDVNPVAPQQAGLF